MHTYNRFTSQITRFTRYLGSVWRIRPVFGGFQKSICSESGSNVGNVEAQFAESMKTVLGKYAPAHIVVGVSGGSDSMALAKVSSEWQMNLKLDSKSAPKLTAVVIDHALRDASHQESVTTSTVLKDRLAMDVKTVKISWEDSQGNVNAPSMNTLQSDARRVRYDALVKASIELGAQVILIAHHHGDLAESLLMRWFRGSGVAGWRSLPSERLVFVSGVLEPHPSWMLPPLPPHIVLVRPLLLLSKEELRSICLRQPSLPWIEDSSNVNQQFDRVRARSALLTLNQDGRPTEKIVGDAASEANQWAQLMDDTCNHLLNSSSIVISPIGCVVMNFSKMIQLVTNSDAVYSDILSDVKWIERGQCNVIIECIGRAVAVVENNHLKPSRKSLLSLLNWISKNVQHIYSSPTSSAAPVSPSPLILCRDIGDCQVCAHFHTENVQLTISLKQNFKGAKRPLSEEDKEFAVEYSQKPIAVQSQHQIGQKSTIFYQMLFRSRFWICGLRSNAEGNHDSESFTNLTPIQSMQDKADECIENLVNTKLEELSVQGRLLDDRKKSTKVRLRRQAMHALLPFHLGKGNSGTKLSQMQDYPVTSMGESPFLPARVRFFPSHASRWIWWINTLTK